MRSKKIAIVGGGITGLYLGWRLSNHHQVTILEKEKEVGGLIAAKQEKDWSWSLDNFYHHFFSSDQKLIQLLDQLDINYQFSKPKNAFWQNNQINNFTSAFDLLAFPGLGLYQKVRLGIAILLLKVVPYRFIPQQTAATFYPKIMGQKAYQAIWEPLMIGKFGSLHKEIAAVWLWARIKKRSPYLGYPEGGFESIVKKLVKQIKLNGGQIKTSQPVTSQNQLKDFDRVIFTLPKTTVNQIIKTNQSSITHLAALNLVLVGQKPILPNDIYWLNIADQDFPFVAIVNQTGLVKEKFYHQQQVSYVGGYYPQNDPLMKMTPTQVLTKFTPYLKKINPDFVSANYQAFLNRYTWAQPIVTPDYAQSIPSFQTPIKNFYLVNMEQVWPYDRGVNYALKLADQFLESVDIDD